MGTEQEMHNEYYQSALSAKLQRELRTSDLVGHRYEGLPKFSIGDDLSEIGTNFKFKVTGIYFCEDRRIMDWCYSNGMNNQMISQKTLVKS